MFMARLRAFRAPCRLDLPMKARDYAHEYSTFHGKPSEIARRAQRNAARAKMEKAGRFERDRMSITKAA